MAPDNYSSGMLEHWEFALAELRKQISQENYETWLGSTRFDGFDGHALHIAIPNRFYADWIRTHYWDLLQTSLRLKTQKTIDVEWRVDPALGEFERSREPAPATVSAAPLQGSGAIGGEPMRNAANLNPKYRFETFVVGPSNQLAHAATTAAASSPGKRYNPLFIYGGVGLGKTHLVNAVGHYVLNNRPQARILYVSAERFTNDFIYALQNHRISEFRSRYRSQCDVLLMDDIQFLATREQTQEEFFHTFNALYHSDKQIVVSSDVSPQHIGGMEARLISRFHSGLVADIQAPELDTRVAIVKKKAELEAIDLPHEVAHFLAEAVKSNVRELEGTLLRLAVKAELSKRSLDLNFAKETLRGQLPSAEQVIAVEDIQKAVSDYFNIRIADLRSHRRHRSVSYPRMIAMYLCRQRLPVSYAELGERFGGKDHTTVISAVRKIEGRVESEDADIKACLDAVEIKLARRG